MRTLLFASIAVTQLQHLSGNFNLPVTLTPSNRLPRSREHPKLAWETGSNACQDYVHCRAFSHAAMTLHRWKDFPGSDGSFKV